MSRNNQYDISKEMLRKIREGNAHLIKEEEEKGEPIAITNEPKFGTNVLQTQINAFKSAVHPGAKFAELNTENPEDSPLVYFPKTGNLVFSGSIPSMANLKFQIRLNDATGAPYIFVEGLSLTSQNCEVLKKLAGFTSNFIDEWNAAGDVLDKLGKGED